MQDKNRDIEAEESDPALQAIPEDAEGAEGEATGEGGDGEEETAEPPEKPPPTPQEIFALMNTDGDDVLDKEEFAKMFKVLHPLTPAPPYLPPCRLLLIHLSSSTSHHPPLTFLSSPSSSLPLASPKVLKLNLSEQQQDQLFALCDCDCSGTISEEEFVRG